MPHCPAPSYGFTTWRSLCMFCRSFPWTSPSCKKYHTTSRQDCELGYTRRRRQLGPLFRCESSYMRYEISSTRIPKQRGSRNILSTPEATIHMTRIVFQNIIAQEYSFSGSMGCVIGQRRTHGDIVTTSTGPMNQSVSLWNGYKNSVK